MWFLSKKDVYTPQEQKTGPSATSARHEGLWISYRQVSWVTSIALLIFFLSFISGYFLGKKAGFEQFASDMAHDSLSDKMYASFCALCDYHDNPNEPQEVHAVGTLVAREISSIPLVNNEHAGSIPPAATPVDLHAMVEASDTLIDPVAQSMTAQSPTIAHAETMAPGPRYCAHLIGFSTHKAAQHFVEKVNNKTAIALFIKERQSKGKRGRIVHWYQVTTDVYTQKEELERVVTAIKQAEKIKNIRIVEVSHA
jgi:hypothetical protein